MECSSRKGLCCWYRTNGRSQSSPYHEHLPPLRRDGGSRNASPCTRFARAILSVLIFPFSCYSEILIVHNIATSSDEGTITPLDPPYPIYVLCFIALLLLTRQTFFTATSTNPKVQNNEKLFYPLSAVTEFLAACLLAVHWREPVHFRR